MLRSSRALAPSTRLPPSLRAWIGRRLSGPARHAVRQRCRTVIYKVDRIGDFVLALSAIRLVLAARGAEECVLVVSQAAAPLAAREFPRTPRIVLPTNAPGVIRDLLPAWWRERRKFRSLEAEELISFSHHQDLYKDVTLSWIAASRRHELNAAAYPGTCDSKSCLELEAHRQLSTTVLGRPISTDAILPRLESVEPRDGNELLVCPLSSQQVRHPPVALLVDALRHWRARTRAKIEFCGPPDRAPMLHHWHMQAASAGLTDVGVAITPGMDDFLSRLAHAGAVLTVESAPSHLATALDKRACIINGGGRFGICSPWRSSARQTHVFHRTPCYGCEWNCDQPEVYCLTGLSSAAIAAALPVL